MDIEKLINAVLQLTVNNRRAGPVFVVLAAAIGLWAIYGGANDLFDAGAVNKMRNSAAKTVLDLQQCQRVSKEKEDAIVDLREKLRAMETKNYILTSQVQLLQSLVAGCRPGSVRLPDTRGSVLHPEDQSGPQ